MWNITTIDTSKPLYLAVVEALERDVRSGTLHPGEQIPTCRKLAQIVGIAPGTAVRVYREAENRGLISAVVGRGTFITADAGKRAAVIDVEQDSLKWDMGAASPLSKPDPLLSIVARKSLHKDRQSALMTYSDPQGLPEHRGVGADWLARFGLTVPPKNIVITAGAQHALWLICHCLFKSGDRIATDHLIYMGMKAAAQDKGVRLEGLPMDHEGMLPNELEVLCKRQHIKGIYVSGRIQNPTNAPMSHERRLALCDIIRRHGLLLIENDPQGFLSDSPDHLLSPMLPAQSIYISSLSKIFLAGLRIAFVAVPSHLVKPLTQGIANSMVCVSPLCVEIAAESILSGYVDETIQQKQVQIAKRVALFRDIFVGHNFVSSHQSMYVWLPLPHTMSAANLEVDAAKRNIRIFNSERFVVGAVPAPEAVRVALTGVADMPNLRRALHTLERLVAKTA
ncbi:MAG: PLP-dependent aminotransferase family protein [Deltaproteobacteria bacterium]|jgi:DNA-binding transcriptional MocR family regulator|nr:PLP-dependent aminotransferase family protein [Deltaproteobacteria bacterium]